MKFLYKVKINPYSDSYHMQCEPLNVSNGTRRNIIFKGNKDRFALFLRRWKANDKTKFPISKYRVKTYNQMISDAESGQDSYVYIWSHLLPKTNIVRESFTESSLSAREYLTELTDAEKKDIIDLQQQILDIESELVDTTDDERKKDLEDRKKDLQDEITTIKDRGE
jgi:hypothetical protein